MAGDGPGTGSGPSSFGIPRQSGRPGGQHGVPESASSANKYQRRLEDIDPARADPSAMIEHHEQLRARPSPYTVEGYIQGFRDLSEAAITGEGRRRSRARLLVVLSLTAILTPVGLLFLGFLHIL
jgi:hypothetical protein